MKKCNLMTCGLKQALGVFVYILLVSGFLYYAESIFGQMKSFWAPVAFLLLFVVSAALTGYLVLGKSAMLYVEGEKKMAVKLFITTVGWMAIMMLVILLGLSMV